MSKAKVLFAALAATSLSSAAFAADLPSRRVAPAYVAPAPMFTWTGLYVGVNLGGVITNTSYGATVGLPYTANSHLTPADMMVVSAGGTQKIGNTSFAGGGQIGYNWQFGSMVVGLEADVGYAGGGSAQNSFGFINGTGSGPGVFYPYALSQKMGGGLAGTVRGRLGFALDRALLYATGGLAWRSGSFSATYWDALFPTIGGASGGGSNLGWTIGAGVEYALTNNWSIKGEYLYADYGSRTVAGSMVNMFNRNFSNTTAHTTRVQTHTFRAGLNYHFGWGAPAAVVAKY